MAQVVLGGSYYESLLRLLQKHKHELDAASLLHFIQTATECSEEEAQRYREKAYEQWNCSGEIEVDLDAVVSSTGFGAYVSAWVWVYNDKEYEEDEDDE